MTDIDDRFARLEARVDALESMADGTADNVEADTGLAQTGCELYRHFDANGLLLYIGISLSTVYRLSQHRTSSGWFSRIVKVTIERFPDRDSAVLAESRAIKEEHPLFNQAQKPPLRALLDKACELGIVKMYEDGSAYYVERKPDSSQVTVRTTAAAPGLISAVDIYNVGSTKRDDEPNHAIDAVESFLTDNPDIAGRIRARIKEARR